nr:hypothetical protein [uncultured Capnocytophaga sp.]
MKKIVHVLSFLAVTTLTAQTPEIEGTYRSERPEVDFEIRIAPENIVEALMTSGTYSLTNNILKINFSKGSMFKVSKAKSDSEQLQITFVPEGNTPFSARFVYLGYENQQGEVEYVSMYNKVQDEEDYTVEIPRTEHLYLVNAYHPAAVDDPKAAVVIEKFAIGKGTNGLNVAVNLDKAVNNELSLLYNPEKQTLTINDRTMSYEPIVFNKVTAPDTNLLQPLSYEKVSNWKHIIPFHEEIDIPLYNPNATHSQKLIQVKSFAEVCSLANKNNTLVAVFYQPKSANAAKEFEELFEWYLQNGLDYNEEEEKTVYSYQPYLATSADAKWLKKKGVTVANQLLIFTPEGELIYKEDTTPAEVRERGGLSYKQASLLRASIVARLMDKVLGNPKAPIAEVEKVFSKIANDYFTSQLYLLAANKPKSVELDNEEEVESLVEEQMMQYSPYFKNIEGVYHFKLTSEAFLAQWKRLVDAHEKDAKLNTDFAAIAAFNTGNLNMYQRAFYFSAPYNETDLKAANYLIRFFKEIKAYNEGLPDKDLMGLTKGSINVFPNQMESIFTDLLSSDNELYFSAVKEAYAQGVRSGMFSNLRYIEFLYDNDLTLEAANAFSNYYQSLMAEETHLIAGLDKDFSKNDDDYSWKYYKLRFANRANNIAWKVYEELKSNTSLLKEANKWAQSAVQLEPENPYYLDTLAHLMYANGDKQQAISTEEKAVQLLSTTDDGHEEERAQVKANLEKMKSGNL